jgi:hypothetical protein
MNFIGTGMSDDICQVKVMPHMQGGYFATYGHFMTPIYITAYEAAVEGNKKAQSMYGTTIRLIDLRQFSSEKDKTTIHYYEDTKKFYSEVVVPPGEARRADYSDSRHEATQKHDELVSKHKVTK